MREYETTFVLNPELDDDQIEENIERIKGVITKNGGEVIDEDVWGKKSLAYEINNFRTGHYTVLSFKAEGNVVDELKRNYKIMTNVIRNLVVKK